MLGRYESGGSASRQGLGCRRRNEERPGTMSEVFVDQPSHKLYRRRPLRTSVAWLAKLFRMTGVSDKRGTR